METDHEKEGVRLGDLRPNSCRWPLGGPTDQVEFFCGKTTEPGSPYCKEHQKRAFVRAYSAIRHDKPPFQIRRKEKPPKASG